MRAERIPGLICALSVVATLALALVYAIEAWPVIDDLGRAGFVRERGVFGAVADEYGHWTGRWSGVGLSYSLGAVLDPFGSYTWTLLGIHAFAVLAAYRTLRLWLGNGATSGFCSAAATTFFALYWLNMPRPAESIYWRTGAVEYLLSLALSALLFTAVCRASAAPRTGIARTATTIALAAGAVFVAGMHELFAGMLLVALAAGTAISWWLRVGDRILWSVVTSAQLLGTAITALAPGNFTRAERFPNAGDLTRTFELLGEELVRAAPWLWDVRLWAVTILFLLSPVVWRARPPWAGWSRVPLRWLVPSVWVVLLLAGLAAPGWAMGQQMPPRSRNGVYFVFLVGWFTTAFVVSRARSAHAIPRWAAAARTTAALALLACMGVPATWIPRGPDPKPGDIPRVLRSNATLAINDLDRLGPLRDAMHRRMATLRAAADQQPEIVVLEPLPAVPTLLHSPEVTPNPQQPRNYSVAVYFGVAAVRGPNPAAGEYFLAPHVLAQLDHLGPVDPDPARNRELFALWGNRFRLRPPPPSLGRESQVRIAFRGRDVRAREPAGIRAQVYLQPRATEPQAVLLVELLAANGARIAQGDLLVTDRGEWRDVELLAPTGIAFRAVRIGVRMPVEGADNTDTWVQLRDVRLLWP